MITLAIETATKNCSVALFNRNELISVKEVENGYSHAERLHQLIKDLLKEEGLAFKKLDFVAISDGPGSYTGLRIGLSTAKGLCFILKTPLIAISSLHNMAYGGRNFFKFSHPRYKYSKPLAFCPMIDARRMEVYAMLLDGELNIIEKDSAVVMDKDEKWHDYFEKYAVVFFGDGAEKCLGIMSGFTESLFIKDEKSFASAANMGELIYQKIGQKDFVDSAYYEPNYLKEFQTTVPKKLI